MRFCGRPDLRAATKTLVIIQPQIQALQNNSIKFINLFFSVDFVFESRQKEEQDMNCNMDKMREDLDDQGFLVLSEVLDSDSLSLYCGLYEVL